MFKPKIILLTVVFSFSILILGCNSKSTAKGEFKKFDLTAKLPSDITIPKNGQNENTKEVQVNGSKVLIKWKTFKVGESSYILSVIIDVPEEIKGTTLVNASVGDPINNGTKEAVLQSNIILIGWDASTTTRTNTGTYNATINSKGELF